MANVLVIDDCQVSRAALRLFLERGHHRVAEATTGAEGQRLFTTEQHDIVFTDIFMPDQDGIETIVNIRRVNKTIPIIAMSAGGSSGEYDYLDHAIKLGANHAFYKPFCSRVITELIDMLPS